MRLPGFLERMSPVWRQRVIGMLIGVLLGIVIAFVAIRLSR
jgi:hypothetical protein